MAIINPNQEYDIIYTLTFAEASGNCPIRLYRGSATVYTGTVYYRAGTSGRWTSLSVSGASTTFPVTDTTMQVAHNWNKSGNNYMTPSFPGATNITSIAISQKSPLTGTMGNHFMLSYANGCSSLTSLDVPATSGLTSVGEAFMATYAFGCSSLTSLDVPDTSSLTSVGDNFMLYYANDCSSLTSLAVPDTSSLTSVGSYFMQNYANGCSSLAELVLPAVGWFKDNNVNWRVPASRLGVLKGRVLNPNDLNDWKALTVSGKTLYTNYIRDPELVYYEGPAQGEAHITAISKLSVSGCKIAKAEAPVTAITAITAQGKKIAKAQVHIIATPVLSVSGIGEEKQVEQGQAHVKTLSSFDVAGEKRARSPPAVLTGEAEVAAEGKKVAKGQVTLTATSEIKVTGRKVAKKDISITSDSDISIQGKKTARGTARLTGKTEPQTEGRKLAKAEIRFTADSELSAEGRKVAKGQVSLTSSSKLSVQGRKLAKAEIRLDSEPKIKTEGKAIKQGTAEIKAVSSIDKVSGRQIEKGEAAVTVNSEIDLTGQKIASGKAKLTANSKLTARVKVDKQVIVTLSIQEWEVGLGLQEYKVKLEVGGMPLIGNTIRLKGEFKDLGGNLTDIEEPKVVIYDNRRNVIKEATPTKAGTGIYYYDLVVPDYPEAGKRNEPLVFEFSGQLGGQPVVGRSSFERVWSE